MNNSEALAKLKKHLKRRKESIFGYFDENLTEAIESAISALEQFPPDWCCGSNRYDWKNIPHTYYWAAKNENGEVWAFLEKPELDEKHGVWSLKYVPHPLMQLIKVGEPSDDWIESLEERPQNFRPYNQ